MKVLSIKQPWAYLIACGLKDVENRVWKCPDSMIGQRILIHASSSIPELGYYELNEEQFKILRESGKGVPIKNLSYSAIIGECTIEDCVQNYPSIWAEQNVWNFVLKDAVLYDRPILNVKGKLKFWNYDV